MIGVLGELDAPGGGTALALNAQYGLTQLDTEPEAGHFLVWQDGQLQLAEVGNRARITVDLVEGAQAHRRKFGGGRGQPVAKAVGLKKGGNPSVLDATAGLGRDAFVLAGLGCSIMMLERNPVACALLQDGLRRAAAHVENRQYRGANAATECSRARMA